MKILTPFVVQTTSKYCKQKRAARAARLFFSHAANQIIDRWHCCCCCRRRLLNSLVPV